MNVKLIVILTLAFLVALFIIQNVAVVEIQYLFWSMRISRSLLIIIVLAIGMVMGWFLRAHINHRKQRSRTSGH